MIGEKAFCLTLCMLKVMSISVKFWEIFPISRVLKFVTRISKKKNDCMIYVLHVLYLHTYNY